MNDKNSTQSRKGAETQRIEFVLSCGLASLQCYFPISSRSAKILQERGQPCPRVSSPTLATRGQGRPRSFGFGLSRAASLR
jgi:hypothetical protein